MFLLSTANWIIAGFVIAVLFIIGYFVIDYLYGGPTWTCDHCGHEHSKIDWLKQESCPTCKHSVWD